MRGLSAAIVIGIWSVWALAWTPTLAAVPRVVVSVKPLHALVAGVMEGVGAPDVVMKSGGSPHAYTLRPSEAEMLAEADVVFWVGPGFEVFLSKPLAALAAKALTVSLIAAPGVRALPVREGGIWEADVDHGRHHVHDHAGARSDGHIWLSPTNAKAMVAVIADVLSARDPQNATLYRVNASALQTKLDALDADVRARLASVQHKPFVVFHDAYQYFEVSYGLTAVGSVTVTPERAPGARRVAEIRQKVESLGPTCVFSEPQFEPKLVQMLIGDTRAKTGVLDPEGLTLAQEPDLYFAMMRNLADSLARCLNAP